MYLFKEKINRTAFFWFDKKLIKNMNWALLPQASKAIFPVIACHVNENGEAWPSEQRIAILSGLTDKIVRKGIRELVGFEGFKFSGYLTERGKRSKRFHLDLSQKVSKGQAFPFYRFVIESGIWRMLKPSARALYIVMRHFGYFDYGLYYQEEDPNPEEKVFANRKFDFCEADMRVMVEYAGIHRTSMPKALNDLENNDLIEPINKNLYKVFLRSKDGTSYKRNFLNQQILDSYRHLLD